MSRAFAGVSVALGALFALTMLASLASHDEASASIPPDAPTQVFDRHDLCQTPCFTGAASEPFTVAEDAAEVQLVIFVVLDAASGPAHVTVTDPDGDLRYERLFQADAPRAATQDVAAWEAEPGEWTLTRSYLGTIGTVSYDAWVVGSEPLHRK